MDDFRKLGCYEEIYWDSSSVVHVRLSVVNLLIPDPEDDIYVCVNIITE